MLGREVILPADIVMGGVRHKVQTASPEKWVSELTDKMAILHHEARRHLKASQLHQKKDYDLRTREYRYLPGDFVYMLDKAKKQGLSPKLQPVWKGPFLVVASRPPVYNIRTRKREKYVHHDLLKLCEDREVTI